MRLAGLDRHVAEARRVEASAHVREARAVADPERQEMRRINAERASAIAAAERGDIAPSDLADAMKDLARRLDRHL